MIDLFVTAASWLCFIVGGFFLFVGSLGMVRLQDFWARLHAASIIDSAGVGLLLLGMMFQTGLTLITVKIVIIVVFLLITGPTASHAVANAAFVSKSRPYPLVEDVTAEEAPQKNGADKSANPNGQKKPRKTGKKT